MTKFDIKAAHKDLYCPKPKFEIVKVPEFRFLSIDGKGDPNVSHDYANGVSALFSVSYALKFASKKAGKDYSVGPLEGLWWADDMNDFVTRDKSNWYWRMMVWQPDWLSSGDFEEALNQVAKKKPNPALKNLKFEKFEEGECAQILHIGSYNDEAATIAKMHSEFIPQMGYKMRGLHHEIYISDPRKTAPEKLKTILRQPIIPD